MSLPHTLPATISELLDDKAVIELEGGQTVHLPRYLIPDGAVGDTVHLAVFTDTDAASEHERLAKAVVEELLRGSP